MRVGVEVILFVVIFVSVLGEAVIVVGFGVSFCFEGRGVKCGEVECIGNFEEWLLVLSIVASPVVRHYKGRVGIESLLVEWSSVREGVLKERSLVVVRRANRWKEN